MSALLPLGFSQSQRVVVLGSPLQEEGRRVKLEAANKRTFKQAANLGEQLGLAFFAVLSLPVSSLDKEDEGLFPSTASRESGRSNSRKVVPAAGDVGVSPSPPSFNSDLSIVTTLKKSTTSAPPLGDTDDGGGVGPPLQVGTRPALQLPDVLPPGSLLGAPSPTTTTPNPSQDRSKRTTLGSSVMRSLSRNMAASRDRRREVLLSRVDGVILEKEELRVFTKDGTCNLWFREMIVSILLNRPTALDHSKHNALVLQTLDPDAGSAMGSGFCDCLSYNSTAGSAYDELEANCPVLLEIINNDHDWFKPCIKTMGAKLFEQSTFGLFLRCFSLGVLSVFDALADIYSIVVLHESGDRDRANICAVFVVFCAILTTLLVVVQNHRQGPRKVLIEVLFVLTAVKPAVDYYRVATDADNTGCVMSFISEQIGCRICEIIVESIPMCFIMFQAYLEGDSTSSFSHTALLASILLSTLTTAYASACMSFEKDTDPHSRSINPDFYGYVPSSRRGRNIIFSSMVVFNFSNTLLKTVTVILIGELGRVALLTYMIADLMLFFAYKAVRDDFRYFLNIPGDGLSYFVSFLVRPLVKLTTDFTGLLQMRKSLTTQPHATSPRNPKILTPPSTDHPTSRPCVRTRRRVLLLEPSDGSYRLHDSDRPIPVPG